MSLLARLSIVLMVGSFPFAIYYFYLSAPSSQSKISSRVNSNPKKSVDVVVADMNRGVETKAKELRELEVKILQNKGSILKLEEDKQAFVSDLESIQSRISDVIKNVKSKSDSRQ